ncbi:MAG: cyclic nucleotide-binding domain-containing protein [Deltaproteobacteria bacterium]|nr:cyclic nucleotide-binding domain-containing protein [Deltaproteobacteria bacterium]
MDHAQIESFLTEQPWLRQLEAFDRKALASALQIKEFAVGDEIISQGAKAHHVYLLLEGSVRVEIERDGERQVVRPLEPGSLFGILALLDHRPRAAACVATEPVVVGMLERSAFEVLSHQHARIAYPFQRALGAQLAADFRWAVRQIEHRLVAVS